MVFLELVRSLRSNDCRTDSTFLPAGKSLLYDHCQPNALRASYASVSNIFQTGKTKKQIIDSKSCVFYSRIHFISLRNLY